MNIREEEFILAIAHHHNLKKASEELNISAAGLSIFLSTLEKRLGTTLFHRVGKSFVPTNAGEMYLEYATKMADFKQEFEARLSDLKNDVTGKISIGLHPRRTTYILPKALAVLSNNYQNVDVKIYEGDTKSLLEKVISGELDFIIISKLYENTALEYSELYRDRLVAVLSPEHRLAGAGAFVEGEKLPWLDLKLFDGERFILQHPDQSSRSYTDMAINFCGARPGKTLVIENLETSSQAAAENLGIAFNMYSFTKNFAYLKPVNYYLTGDRNFFISYYVVKRKDRFLPKYTNLFIEALRKAASENCLS